VPRTKAETAAAAWNRAEEEDAFWQAHEAEYQKRYPDQYVAVLDGEVVAHSSNLDELVAELANRGLTPGDVWGHFFSAHPKTLILVSVAY
jgi:hypothetical protein